MCIHLCVCLCVYVCVYMCVFSKSIKYRVHKFLLIIYKLWQKLINLMVEKLYFHVLMHTLNIFWFVNTYLSFSIKTVNWWNNLGILKVSNQDSISDHFVWKSLEVLQNCRISAYKLHILLQNDLSLKMRISAVRMLTHPEMEQFWTGDGNTD